MQPKTQGTRQASNNNLNQLEASQRNLVKNNVISVGGDSENTQDLN